MAKQIPKRQRIFLAKRGQWMYLAKQISWDQHICLAKHIPREDWICLSKQVSNRHRIGLAKHRSLTKRIGVLEWIREGIYVSRRKQIILGKRILLCDMIVFRKHSNFIWEKLVWILDKMECG